MPRVSVCMAVFNGAETIRLALESLQAQTFKDYDLLVLDDGSEDGSAEIAQSFGAQVIRQANAGLGAGRKRLVEEASGELIAFLDHDDEWVPDKLEKQVAQFGEGVVLVHSDCWYLDEDGRSRERNLILPSSSRPFDHILPDNLIIASSAVFSKCAMLAAGNFIPETVRCSDWYGWFLLAPQGRFVHIPEKQVRYRVLSSSLANSGYRFQSAKRFLLRDIILPRVDEFLSALGKEDRNKYERMIREDIGIAASTMAKFLDSEGERDEARVLHKEAVELAGKVPRVRLRALKHRLKL
jgi:glycosyltransferase involved in cell wall biosynthesis